MNLTKLKQYYYGFIGNSIFASFRSIFRLRRTLGRTKWQHTLAISIDWGAKWMHFRIQFTRAESTPARSALPRCRKSMPNTRISTKTTKTIIKSWNNWTVQHRACSPFFFLFAVLFFFVDSHLGTNDEVKMLWSFCRHKTFCFRVEMDSEIYYFWPAFEGYSLIFIAWISHQVFQSAKLINEIVLIGKSSKNETYVWFLWFLPGALVCN